MSLLPNPDDEPIHRPTRPPGNSAAQANRFSLRLIGESQPVTPRHWVAENLIEDGTLVVMYGLPGSAKSFLALDLACSVATGGTWLGCQTKKGQAIYVALEGKSGLLLRHAAWEQVHCQNAQVYEPKADIFSFLSGADTDDLIKEINEKKSSDDPVKLVVFDTLSRSIPEEDENAQAVMSRVVAGCGRISSQTGAAVVLIHHPNKANSRELRGSSVLQGSADTCLLLKKSGSTVTVKVIKQRDGVEGIDYRFRLVPVEVQIERENPAQSCTIEFAGIGNGTHSKSEMPTGGFAGKASELLELLNSMRPQGTPSPSMKHLLIPYEQARDAALEKLYVDGSKEARRKQFQRDLSRLETEQKIGRASLDILLPLREEEFIDGSGQAA